MYWLHNLEHIKQGEKNDLKIRGKATIQTTGFGAASYCSFCNIQSRKRSLRQ